MKRIYDSNELRAFNTPGNHWITASDTKFGLMANVVEYTKIEELIIISLPSIIGVYSSDIEPIASYMHSDIHEEVHDAFFNRSPIKKTINYYNRFKQAMLALNTNNNKYFVYAPSTNKWYNPKYDELIPVINKTGFLVSVQVTSDKGEMLYSYIHPALKNSTEYADIENSFGQLLVAIVEGATLIGSVELLSNLI